MTTSHDPGYRLPRAAALAAAVQLAGLALLSWFTTMLAMLVVMFGNDPDDATRTGASVLLALLVGLPAPTAAVALVASLVRVRRRGSSPLVRFETVTCGAIGVLLVAVLLGSGAIGHLTTGLDVSGGVLVPFVIYAALAAAVVGSVHRRQR